MKILLVEDDETLIAVLTKRLAAQNYVVDTVKDGEMGWNYGSTFDYDLMILDLMLPKLDGISLCKRFRADGYVTPILLLTSEDTSTTKIQGLDAGADDYVVKPFDPEELIARIRALLRRGSANPFPLLTCGDLVLNPSTCEISYGEQPLSLTTKEYELLELLLRDSQQVISTTEILDRLWSSEEFPSEATVRSHIRRVRRKLVLVGAPADFIATMHGRGYYLKPLELEESGASAPSHNTAALTEVGKSTAVSQPPADAQQQYLAFLNDTWKTTRPKSLEQVAVLWQTAIDLQASQLTPEHQAQARQVAHKLAGTIGIFGLTKAMHIARQLDHWLKQELLQPKQAPMLQALVTALQHEIHSTQLIQATSLGGISPQVLIVSSDLAFNTSLVSAAATRGIHAEVMPFDSATTAIAPGAEESRQAPDVLLFRFPSIAPAPGSGLPSLPNPVFAAFEAIARHYPTVPILVVGDGFDAENAQGGNLGDRLEVVRWGSKLFLDPSTPPSQIIAAAMRLVHTRESAARVMIVDDDHEWLRMLPTLLKPWGFKVSTLDDPQQFLTVLQAVTPDVLVLDINMPHINGFELCQVLRSDPRWQRLPVLFLSVLTDALSQNQAFTVGADDYLVKPIKGIELANRIVCRLQRVRAWAS